ncbi:MAG: glycogen/starch synthase [Acidobacteriota bacterium]|nr:glycogen/starch synthase [Acidobacteriota bacterium]
MAEQGNGPRILMVTPEITYLPKGMGNFANYLTAKAGGLADVSATLVSQLYEAGEDVHVALPNYRTMFSKNIAQFIKQELDVYRSVLPSDRIHLAEDRCFYYRSKVYDDFASENLKLAMAFQREVINNILPRVHPDIIHCNDWMTGLIPAVAYRMSIPSLFTVHNIHTVKTTLENIENSGIDAAQFWTNLYFNRPPDNYEETRGDNPVDFLVSGIFAATAINTVSPKFLDEIVEGRHPFIPDTIRKEFSRKKHNGQAVGVLNAPDASFDPRVDEYIPHRFCHDDHYTGKRKNKAALQQMLGLEEDVDAPLFFWPSRLDPVQKGCKLLGDLFYELIARYSREKLQIVVVANGPYQKELHHIVRHSDLHRRASICDFEEGLSRLGYAAADFLFMPSSFEPCGLPQMIGPIYGTLPVAHDTGGIHDTVSNLSVKDHRGNGFLFEVHDVLGLKWAVEQAMKFHALPLEVKAPQITRIMTEAKTTFNQKNNTDKYKEIYRSLLNQGKVKND